VIQLTAGALVVDMTAGLPAGDAASSQGKPTKSGKPGDHAPHRPRRPGEPGNLRLVAALDRRSCVKRGRLCCGPCHLCRPIEGCESLVESALNFGLIGDGLRELGLDGGALAAGEAAAPKLGPQFLDVVVESNHLGLLPY
jgi:hypothetical protein